ncbi:hypothetical protein BB560_003085 [Smittium megazygosporum]|uniref:Protein kinase domain-containing protein n=1 Tax=Smittium megazygosporum TaxID=133381 RepID=A0A2T9ZD25_9FUNG|nr:hypothetical protein BB560_003085 [Smittium megazygosporum]
MIKYFSSPDSDSTFAFLIKETNISETPRKNINNSSPSKSKLNPKSDVFVPSKTKGLASFSSQNLSSKKLNVNVSEFIPTNKLKAAEGLSGMPIVDNGIESSKGQAFVDPGNQSFGELKNDFESLEISGMPPLPFSSNSQFSAVNLKPFERASSDFYMDSGLRERLENNKIARCTFIDNNVPTRLHMYNGITPIEFPSPLYSLDSAGLYTSLYKAFSLADGKTYCIHRVHDCKITSAKSFSSLESFVRLKHPNIVNVYEAFTTHAFGDNSLCLVYDYYPHTKTIGDGLLSGDSMEFTESQAWRFLIQMLSAIRATHSSGLCVGILDLHTIICTSPDRYRIAWVGLNDIIYNPLPKMISSTQIKDIYNLGIITLKLLSRNIFIENDIVGNINELKLRYSSNLVHLITQMVTRVIKSVNVLLAPLSSILISEIDNSNKQIDFLEDNLSLELENDRISRLTFKLNFIVGRPELRNDLRWSETGDRYLLSLFYGYVFHQVDRNGNPVLDIAHVVSNLNKLDAGSNERIMLTSKDEKTCLIVSFLEVKKCLEFAYKEMVSVGH